MASPREEFLRSLFQVPLVPLGQSDARFDGIFIPEPELGAEKVGITDQFLENAEDYNERYSDTQHFSRLFQLAFRETGYAPQAQRLILDIGSGAGTNTVLPCLRLFDACRIVATDLSPNLLRILEAQMRRLSLAERVCCVATDAMKDFFLPSRFDIVTGASILHHLIDPEQALRSAYRVLKPQGTAFFFEPFEGCALVRVAFTLILDSAPRMAPSLDERVSALLVAMIEDFRVRTGSDKSAELYRHLDDKWLFTRRYFEQAARRIGFRSLTIIPQSALDTQYRDFVASLLRVTGLTDIGMPDWAWRIVDTFDGALSTEMRWDVPLEGIIVLTKD